MTMPNFKKNNNFVYELLNALRAQLYILYYCSKIAKILQFIGLHSQPPLLKFCFISCFTPICHI